MRETLVKSEEFKDSPVEKISKDWEVVSLKNEINILHGYAFEGEYFADEPPGDVLLVPGNFHRDGGLYFNDNNTKYYRGLIPDGTVLEKGELLIVMTDLSPRTLILGRVVLLELPFRVLHNQRIGKIVPKLPNTWDKRFLLLVMNSDTVRRNIISNATGTTVRHTSPDRILANVVLKPPVEEQSKIAEILDTIDLAIAHTSSLIAKLKQMKAGLLQDLLTRGLDENGELRDAIAHPEQFKDSPLGQIPKDWDTSILDKIISIIDCKHYTPKYVSDGIPIVRPRNVKVDGLDFSDIDYVLEKEYKLLTDKHTPRQGDIVFSRNASFGIPCYVDATQRFAIGQDVVIMTELSANTRFVYYTLISDSTEKQIQNVSAGSTFGRINLACIRELVVPVPPREDQERIAQILDTYDTRIRTEETYRDKLKLQKQGLMHDLLTGKVRVKDA